jgi:hypothetical protein
MDNSVSFFLFFFFSVLSFVSQDPSPQNEEWELVNE